MRCYLERFCEGNWVIKPLELRFKTQGAVPERDFHPPTTSLLSSLIQRSIPCLLRPSKPMPNHWQRPSALTLTLVLFITALSAGAAESGSPDKAKLEQAAPEKRPAGSEAGSTAKKNEPLVKILGLTLADPTPELMHKHGHSAEFPGPIITQIQDSAFFLKGTAPSAGCSIWIIEHPAKGFGLDQAVVPSFRPQTAKEFAAAIIACAIPPAEYASLLEAKKKTAREQIIQQKDDPALQSRLAEIAAVTLSAAQAGKYTCRLVYNYPDQKGTMTTEIYLTKAELDEIRPLAGR